MAPLQALLVEDEVSLRGLLGLIQDGLQCGPIPLRRVLPGVPLILDVHLMPGKVPPQGEVPEGDVLLVGVLLPRDLPSSLSSYRLQSLRQLPSASQIPSPLLPGPLWPRTLTRPGRPSPVRSGAGSRSLLKVFPRRKVQIGASGPGRRRYQRLPLRRYKAKRLSQSTKLRALLALSPTPRLHRFSPNLWERTSGGRPLSMSLSIMGVFACQVCSGSW